MVVAPLVTRRHRAFARAVTDLRHVGLPSSVAEPRDGRNRPLPAFHGRRLVGALGQLLAGMVTDRAHGGLGRDGAKLVLGLLRRDSAGIESGAVPRRVVAHVAPVLHPRPHRFRPRSGAAAPRPHPPPYSPWAWPPSTSAPSRRPCP